MTYERPEIEIIWLERGNIICGESDESNLRTEDLDSSEAQGGFDELPWLNEE